MKAENRIDLKIDNKGKGRRFESRFLEAGLVKYSFGVCLLNKDALNNFVYKFVGCPVIIDHKDITDENAKDERVGVISKVWYNEFDGWFWCEGVLFDDEAISLIKDKGYNVSCQYNIDDYIENTAGELHNGNPYDLTILDGTPEHLAIVKNPRYEEALIAVNKGEDMKAENTEFRTGYDSEGEAYVYPIEGADDKEDFEKQTKSTKKDEDRHQKTKDLEDKAYKEFKKIHDNYIKEDIPLSEFSKKKEEFNKKYQDAFKKLESDRFVSFEDFAKREHKLDKKDDKSEKKEDKKEEKKTSKQEKEEEFSEDFKKLADETATLEQRYLENPNPELAKQINKNRNKLLANKKYAELMYRKNIATPDKEETATEQKTKIARYRELQTQLSEIGKQAQAKVLGENYKGKITEEQHKQIDIEADKLGYGKLWKEYSELSKEISAPKMEEKKETKKEDKKEDKVKDLYEKEYKKALKEIEEGKDYAQINYHTNIGEMKSALSHLKKFDSDWDKYDVYENIKEYDDLSDDWNKEQIGRIAREKAAQETLKKWISEGKDRTNEYYKIYEPHKLKDKKQPKQLKLFNALEEQLERFVSLVAKNFDESKHKRDEDGKFTDSGNFSGESVDEQEAELVKELKRLEKNGQDVSEIYKKLTGKDWKSLKKGKKEQKKDRKKSQKSDSVKFDKIGKVLTSILKDAEKSYKESK